MKRTTLIIDLGGSGLWEGDLAEMRGDDSTVVQD